jgi:CelD/BcsL family acetyltransferase involved in cellulose biosynthesis
MSALAERPAALPLAESRSLNDAARPWRSVAIVPDMAAIETEWRALEARALVTPYQSYGWINAFVATVGAAHEMDFRHAVLRDATGAAQAILPLVITRRGGIRFAEFIGGKHANYHMGL